MPSTEIDGILTRYEIFGSGQPLLMFAPGGFDATIEKWSTQGIYAQIKPLTFLSTQYSCIVFDRRECGRSGGRLERITWAHYATQATGLLDHLGLAKAHVMGGCMGCCSAMAMSVLHPDRVLSMILFWPVGGARYRLSGQARFMAHLAFVQANGLEAVIKVAREGKSFGAEPRGGPWATVIRNDEGFAGQFMNQDLARYTLIVSAMTRGLIDRDSVPGAEPEDLLCLRTPTFIVPGSDPSHATSAAHFLRECIQGAQYWDVPVSAQTESATALALLGFLGRASADA